MASVTSSPRKASRNTTPARIECEPVDDSPVESVLGSIQYDASNQASRLYELNSLIEELMNTLGIHNTSNEGESAEKLSVAPYGRLDEIRNSQTGTYRMIENIESNIYGLRRALM